MADELQTAAPEKGNSSAESAEGAKGNEETVTISKKELESMKKRNDDTYKSYIEATTKLKERDEQLDALNSEVEEIKGAVTQNNHMDSGGDMNQKFMMDPVGTINEMLNERETKAEKKKQQELMRENKGLFAQQEKKLRDKLGNEEFNRLWPQIKDEVINFKVDGKLKGNELQKALAIVTASEGTQKATEEADATNAANERVKSTSASGGTTETGSVGLTEEMTSEQMEKRMKDYLLLK